MKFALFYEIPVAGPWTKTSELEAYRNTIEQSAHTSTRAMCSRAAAKACSTT